MCNLKKPNLKTTFILGTLTVIFGLISCENDNALKPEDIVVNDTNTVVYDTIKPLEYFPAYPGSYWVYNNGETLKVDGYEKYIYNTAGYTAVPDYDTIVIPKLILNGIFNNPDSYAYVKEYSISKSSNSN